LPQAHIADYWPKLQMHSSSRRRRRRRRRRSR
jgi:hypothetical protein